MKLTMKLTALGAALAVFLASLAASAQADVTHVAVAANFTEPAKEIAALFKQKTGHEAVLSFGASGAFFTQITHGAPFEVFLSADAERPKAAIDGGFAIPDSLFTYAIGKLALWSRVIDVTNGEAALKAGNFQKLSIANPVAAPYGAAAVETMKALGVYDALKPKIVQGNSIAQAFQFVDTRNAELGFVALSQLHGQTEGTRWEVPVNLYSPIRQDAVLLKTGANSEASKAFLDFLKGPEARAIIEQFGYALEVTGVPGISARDLGPDQTHDRTGDHLDALSPRRRDAARLVARPLEGLVQGSRRRHRLAADGAAPDRARLLPPDRPRPGRPRRRDRVAVGRAHPRLHVHRPGHRIDHLLDAVCRAADPQRLRRRSATGRSKSHRLCGPRRAAPSGL